MRFRVVAIPVGAVILFMGLIWFLQGIGILPGSIMTGSTFWAVAGGLTVILGAALVVTGVKGRKTVSQQ